MDQRQIERFVDVVESGSLSRTSKRLNISQPALSKSLRLLEEQLGAPLLVRGPRGVRPTKFGDTFYRRACCIAAELRRVRDDLAELKGSGGGEIAVGVTPGPGVLDRVIPAAVDLTARSRPALRITVRSGTLSELLPALSHGRLDLILTVLDERVSQPGLKVQLLFEDHFVLAVQKGHPLLGQRVITLKDLTKFRWVLLQDALPLWQAVEELAIRNRISYAAPIESNSVVFVRAMARKSRNIAVLPSYAAELSAEAGELVSIPFERVAEHSLLPRLLRPMGLVHSAESELTRAAHALLRSIIAVCRNLDLAPAPR
jgi:DNA-binding transcriptional LysR family regulator